MIFFGESGFSNNSVTTCFPILLEIVPSFEPIVKVFLFVVLDALRSKPYCPEVSLLISTLVKVNV